MKRFNSHYFTLVNECIADMTVNTSAMHEYNTSTLHLSETSIKYFYHLLWSKSMIRLINVISYKINKQMYKKK